MLFVVVTVLLTLALLSLGRPRAARAVCGWLRSLQAPSLTQLDKTVRALAYANPGFAPFFPFDEPRPLSDEELYQAWRASYPSVGRAKSACQLMDALEERGSYLDELERRHPAAFTAWLACEGSAAGDPFDFVHHNLDDSGCFDWDDLTRRTDGDVR